MVCVAVWVVWLDQVSVECAKQPIQVGGKEAAVPLVLHNPLGWTERSVVQVSLSLPPSRTWEHSFRVCREGAPVSSQVVAKLSEAVLGPRGAVLEDSFAATLAVAVDMPPLSLAVHWLHVWPQGQPCERCGCPGPDAERSVTRVHVVRKQRYKRARRERGGPLQRFAMVSKPTTAVMQGKEVMVLRNGCVAAGVDPKTGMLVAATSRRLGGHPVRLNQHFVHYW